MKQRFIALMSIMVMVAGLLAGCEEKKDTLTIKTPEIQSIVPGGEVEDIQNHGEAFPDLQQSQNQEVYTVYTLVPETWTEAYLWAWSESEGDLFAVWPGEPMKQISGLWYAINIPVEYDWIVVNNNGQQGLQTQDICTGSKDAWILWEDDTGYLYNNTYTIEQYDDKFESMGISDEKAVSASLNTMSAIQQEGNVYVKLEYGITSAGIQEFAVVFHYCLSGMSDAQVSATIEQVRQSMQAYFGGYNCAETRDELRNDVLVVTVCFSGMDDALNVREMAEAMGAFMGTDSSSLLDQNGKIMLDSVFALEKQGIDVKVE